MLKRLSRLLLALALVGAVGGHWAVLQSVAWVSMVATYSQDATVEEAITKTFSGKAPCQLCKVVAEGKNAEKQQEQQKLVVKLDLFSEAPAEPFDAPPIEPILSPGSLHALSWHEVPPLPPPITA